MFAFGLFAFGENMATELESGNVETLVSWEYQNAIDLSTPVDKGSSRSRNAYTNGTGAKQGNKLWHDRRTLAAAANDDLDLAGGLTDGFGNALTFTLVKAIMIWNRGVASGDAFVVTTGEDIVFGPAGASNPFITPWDGITTAKNKVGSDGKVLLESPTDGWAVVAGTGDILRVSHDGVTETITYDIVIIGS